MSLTWRDYKKWLAPILKSSLPEKLAAPGPQDWGTDSRTIGKKTWFVPIKGENFDGHDFINTAMEMGAAGFLYANDSVGKFDQKYADFGIKVDDTLTAYQHIASGWRETLKNTTVAAITGSVGKTTTKEMISCIFRHAGNCFSTLASFNNEIGVPKSLLSIEQSHQYAMLEFGAKRLGNIKFLCELAVPDVTVLLNIGVSHLGIFGSIENLRQTKLEIFRDSSKNCILVANHDDPIIVNAAKDTGKKTLTFGRHPEATVCIEKTCVLLEKGVTDIALRYEGQTFQLQLKSCHSAFSSNAAAAVATALAAKIPITTAINGLKTFEPVAGRFKVLAGKHITVVDDTYNANPDSMKAGLSSVFEQFPGKRINLLLGDMLELGDESANMHRDIGHFLSLRKFGQITTVGDFARYYHHKNENDRNHYETVEDAIAHSDSILKDAEILFIKGSNGIRLSKFLTFLQSSGILP